jgi:NAD(P)-dependent dehydrogenase (short-subunit alcohol dehydrogenase family)
MTKKAIVVVTGAKFTKARRFFTAGQEVKYFELQDGTYKMNAGSGSVYALHDEYELIVHGYNREDGQRLEELGLLTPERYHVFDLLDKKAVSKFIKEVARLKRELNLPVHVVHYGAASETKVELPYGSLRHSIWEAPGGALRDLVANNCETLLNLLQEMKRQDIFEKQAITKVVAISAVAAVRSLAKLGLDCVQKGAGHSLLRTMALELTPENIYITEVMPGSTDGGYYDNNNTLEVSLEHSKNIGYTYDAETKPVFTAEQIGEAVQYVMNARCNVRELVLIPYGQYPHLGA